MEKIKKIFAYARVATAEQLGGASTDSEKHGWWVCTTTPGMPNRSPLVCSVCGKAAVRLYGRSNVTPECPNCGAKLDGVKKGE